ncbi:hypothetical protein P170DRAFT_75216 [Aspergillus steynii IBT 23096]|uniref:Uncharacterized protein n=1 Tax=Aspergillus steynii IBT 23096 TaxID=1392250 RepID=A0A2I2FRQ4_9EURO|nr:uncharacterized protein P170DRAFT_75216 [Aspergillus steynii IBT 23096]PLB43286.1 hypothetical protein P170DRAFT_75216 [Aspergillus steynii IBT 23096]
MDLLAKMIDRGPPSVEFLDIAIPPFKAGNLQFIRNRFEGLRDMDPALASSSLDKSDFLQLQNILTTKGLLGTIDGDKCGRHFLETSTLGSKSEESNPFFHDIIVTEEMVRYKASVYRRGDPIGLLLRQQTHLVIVTAEAIPAIIKYNDLSTVRLLLSPNQNVIIPSVLLFSLHGTKLENMEDGLRSKLRIAVKEDIVCAAIENNSDQNLAILNFLFVSFGCPNVVSTRALVAAASTQYNSTQMLELLLACNQGRIDDLEPIAVAAAKNDAQGDHPLVVLFNHFGHEIRLSDSLLVAAAENKGTKHALLQCVSRNCQMTPSVLAAAARNPIFAMDMMAILLERFQTPLTEDVLIEAARNESQGIQLFQLLLGRRRPEFRLTESILRAYMTTTTGKYIVPDAFLDSSLYVDPHCLRTAAILSRSLSYSQFDVFLSNSRFLNPQELAFELAQECNDATLRMILERYGHEIDLSEGLLKRAVRNTSSETNILKVLIFAGEGVGKTVAVTSDLVAVAAGNSKYGYESVQLLRTRRSKAPFVNSEALLAAASNEASFSLQLLRLLFRCCQDSILITTKLLSAAAKNRAHGTEMLRFLLSRLENQGDDQINFEKVLKAAATNTKVDKSWRDLHYIWHSPLGLLVRKRRDRIKITEAVLVAAATNLINGKRCILLLMKYGGQKLKITANVAYAAAGNPTQACDILILLLNHPTYHEVGVSEQLLSVAVQNDSIRIQDDVIKLMLSHHNAPLPISERVVMAATKSTRFGRKMLGLLLNQYKGPVCISNSTLQEVSEKLGKAMYRRLQARQIHPQVPHKTEWRAVWRLFVLFVSCYLWPLFHRDKTRVV